LARASYLLPMLLRGGSGFVFLVGEETMNLLDGQPRKIDWPRTMGVTAGLLYITALVAGLAWLLFFSGAFRLEVR
jgi:hypothetical protein